jgi:hypothetical protein
MNRQNKKIQSLISEIRNKDKVNKCRLLGGGTSDEISIWDQ